MSTTVRILLVEDNPGDAGLIREMLTVSEAVSFEIESASRLTEALARLESGGFDIILLDLGLPDSQELETFRTLHHRVPAIPIIVLTGNDRDDLAIAAVREGAQDYLVKGCIESGLLRRAIQYALERKQMEEQRDEITRRQEAINLLQQSLLIPAPFEDKLKIVCDGIVRIFGADFCRVWLIRPGDLCTQGCIHADMTEGPHICRYRDRCLHLLASSGRYTHTDGTMHRRVPFGCYKIGRVAAKIDHKFLTNDAQNDPRVHNHEWARDFGLVSFVGYQLKIPGEDPLGVLALFSKHPIRAADDAMLDSLSSSVALMIQQSASEQALRKSEEKYRNIFENAMEGIFQSTPGGRCLSVNPSLAQMLGFDSPEEMISSVHDINARLCANPEERARLHKLLDNQGFVRGFIAECVHRTKVNVFIALNERSVRDKDGRILFYEGTTQDITEQVKSHMQISRINKCMISLRPDPRENIEMILNTTVETLGGACVLYNRFGSDRSLLCTRGIWHKPEGDEPEGMPDGYISYDVIVKGEPVIIEDLAVTKFEESDPNVRKYGLKSYLGYPVKVRGKTVGSLCLFDVTKRLFSKGEIKIFGIFAQALAMEEARIQNQRAMGMLARFPDENPYPVLRVAEDGTITYANTAAEKLPEDFQCRKGERVPEEWRESAAEALRTGVVRTIEFKTGEKYFLVTLSPIQTAGYVNIYGLDITKRKILESHVLHLQKMEAIGTLAGGIAHDINNMLAGIIGYINLMRKELSIDSQLTEDIQSIEKLSWRIADLVQGLLAFARKGKYVPEPLNIVPIVEEVLKLMGQTAGKLAAIEMECVPDVFNIIGDQSQINQLLMNLCINACEAMPNGGTLTVRIANEELDEEFFRIHSALKKGPFVSIRVSDTGVGMNEETRQRIFDPFFTTKDQKTGTGLGLSMVIGIAEVHGGCVEVESEPGRGSTFTIFFPATEKSIEEALPGPVETLRGNETILIVDDEKDFRVSTGRSLRELGYTVLEAASGDEALETLEKKSEEIDLVLLDMIMKGMGGPTTFRRMREIVPDLAVIICTGYSIDSNCHRLLKKGAKGFIQKPFEHNYLALRIREVLSSC